MIASVIGRTFLEAFNEKYDLALTAKEFFNEHYFKMFFNHSKYMQWITNSPFVQMKAGQKPHLLNTEERYEKLLNLHNKVISGKPEASIAIGFPASEESEFASTSGLVSDIVIPSDEEDIYLSWIGSGLGIGVAGGYSIFFDQPDILLRIFDGWSVYREYLNEPTLDKLRGNQINTWNGQWLTFAYGNDFRENFDFARLQGLRIFQSDGDGVEVNTVNWAKLFFSISQKFPNESFTGYIYSLGQTNKTIGFVPFQFKSGTELKYVYRKIFSSDHQIKASDFESLFGIHIKRACELGSIGLQALRPERLKSFFGNSSNLSFKKEEDTLLYHAFKTWLVTMLSKNKEEIKDYTIELARAVLKYRNTGKGNSRITLVEKELFESKSKKDFIQSLTTMIDDVDQEDLVYFKNLKDEIHLMTNEEFTYFCTLLKFDYSYLKRQN
ncbi:hypothetical protein FC093_16470 [Ilyomonas limi]|uniref:Uncharacterized protein n=1 Tax=Ilyomonas limi TaxID=2575867 RepID=A0A4U3KW48_9BACT|nr:hypothetical protein [Ilyomonas limi]TKK66630.1 hypothetical protein FC093_16470 [Ilyomonas limi]